MSMRDWVTSRLDNRLRRTAWNYFKQPYDRARHRARFIGFLKEITAGHSEYSRHFARYLNEVLEPPEPVRSRGGGLWSSPSCLSPTSVADRANMRYGNSSMRSSTCCAAAAPGDCCPMIFRRGGPCILGSGGGAWMGFGGVCWELCVPPCGNVQDETPKRPPLYWTVKACE